MPCLDRTRSTPGFRCVSPHHDIAVLTDAFTHKTNMLFKSPELSVIHLYYMAATSSRHDAWTRNQSEKSRWSSSSEYYNASLNRVCMVYVLSRISLVAVTNRVGIVDVLKWTS